MIALLASLAMAAPALESGNTAHTLSQADSKLTLGVFRPWAFKISDRTDLVTTGILGSLLAPRLDLKHRVITQDDDHPFTVSLVGGVNIPTPILLVSKGWIMGENDRIPFAMQAKFGLLASRQYNKLRLTGGAELRAGFTAGASDITPRDFYFLDWALAPLVEGPVVGHFKVQADYQPMDPVLFTAEIHMQATSAGVEFASRLWALWGVSDHVALGAGYHTQLDQRPNGYTFYYVPGLDLQLRY